MERANSRMPRLKKAAFAASLFLLLGLVVEMAARGFDAWTYVSVDELRSVYRQRRSWRLGHSWPLQRGDYPYLPYIPNPEHPDVNELGFWGAPFPREKAPDVFRIVCLGGSTTWNGYPAYLEEALRSDLSRYGLNVHVINAGNQQWTTMDSTINFITRCLPLDPDAIVVYHAVNDAVFAFGGETSPDYSHIRKRFERDPPLIWDRLPACLDYSSAFVGFRAIFERKVGQRGIPITVTREHEHSAERRYNGMAPFRENLFTLSSIARAREIEVFLCTQVFNRKHAFRTPLQERWGDAVDDANAITRSLTDDSNHVHVIDVATSLRGNNEWMTDYVHFTEEGKQHLADYIARHIRPHLSEMVARRERGNLLSSRSVGGDDLP